MANNQPYIDSQQTKQFRDNLTKRNLYSPDRKYYTPLNERERIVASIASVTDVLKPYTSYDLHHLKNTVYGRLLTADSITNATSLTDIGLVMLGKQFAQNVSSTILRRRLDLNPIRAIQRGSFKAENYEITQRSSSGVFNRIANYTFGLYGKDSNPFAKDGVTNEELMEHTGSAQLDILFEHLNRNSFKPNEDAYIKESEKILNPLQDTNSKIVGSNREFFTFSKHQYNPYGRFLNFAAGGNEDTINDQMRRNYYEYGGGIMNYGEDFDTVSQYFGETRRVSQIYNSFTAFNGGTDNHWLSHSDDGVHQIDNLIWGLDGATDDTNKRLIQLRSNNSRIEENINNGTNLGTRLDVFFNIKTGLLEYTKNLMNVTKGQVVDMTKKVFTVDGKGDTLSSLRGANVWLAPNDALPGFRNKTGVRQHTALDPYDKLPKAIRFDGNGHPESVIFDSVIPKIHPIIREDKLDAENMMFSIENLALRAIKVEEGGYGLVEDTLSEGMRIPLSEVGPNMGRQMWFAPYGIEINETTDNRIESTVMMGRGEPIYNYQSSERSATLRFKLIIDHPPNVKDLRPHHYKRLLEFFAFGGGDEKYTGGQDEIKTEKPKKRDVPQEEPSQTQYSIPKEFALSYQHDYPKPGADLTTYFDTPNSYKYEIKNTGYNLTELSRDKATGINSEVLYESVTQLDPNAAYSTQYVVQEENMVEFDRQIKDLFQHDDARKMFKIQVEGSASASYMGDENVPYRDQSEAETYNQKLSQRRVDAAIELIKKRIASMFPDEDFNNLGIVVEQKALGSSESDHDKTTVDRHEDSVKRERAAKISIASTGYVAEPTEPEEATEEEEIAEESKRVSLDERLYRHRGMFPNDEKSQDGGVLGGFESIVGNFYYPAFYSQTPEEFHRRLTFLNQCMRQGPAMRIETEVDENNIVRAKNSVFGRQPICVIRIGDFFNTKIIINNINIDYSDTPWDFNPEGFGVQPMMAEVTLQVKLIGGQSLKGPIDALQNAISFNYYANSSFSDKGIYRLPHDVARKQKEYLEGIKTSEETRLRTKYNIEEE
jgi:hypothetical protein